MLRKERHPFDRMLDSEQLRKDHRRVLAQCLHLSGVPRFHLTSTLVPQRHRICKHSTDKGSAGPDRGPQQRRQCRVHVVPFIADSVPAPRPPFTSQEEASVGVWTNEVRGLPSAYRRVLRCSDQAWGGDEIQSADGFADVLRPDPQPILGGARGTSLPGCAGRGCACRRSSVRARHGPREAQRAPA
jgi:hypothetical protein